MHSEPTLAQQRALVYAVKPFAALSILSSMYVFYYLLVRHPEKRSRMYHRLILATFVNLFVNSLATFARSWALPADTNYVGAVGNNVTCSVVGAFFIVTWMTVASYYTSLSIFGLVAVKNNFRQEKFHWIEKWIHIWVYTCPLIVVICCAIDWDQDWDFCRVAALHHGNLKLPDKLILTFVSIDFIVGVSTILYLWIKFPEIQKQVDDAIGMRRLIESAMKKRYRDVTKQTGLYLLLFGYSYFLPVLFIWVETLDSWVYTLGIVALCVNASQACLFTIIYFSLQKPDIDAEAKYAVPTSGSEQLTVAQIRENAKRPRNLSIVPRFSFCIFDGEPAEDSPWAQYFEEASESVDNIFVESMQDKQIDNGMMTSLLL